MHRWQNLIRLRTPGQDPALSVRAFRDERLDDLPRDGDYRCANTIGGGTQWLCANSSSNATYPAGSLEREQLRGAAAKSNGVLRDLGPDTQWVESYVAADKTFCVYLAKDEEIIKKHAEISGFPATKITEVRKMIDPTTEHTP
jgi:hypothetical protein